MCHLFEFTGSCAFLALGFWPFLIVVAVMVVISHFLHLHTHIYLVYALIQFAVCANIFRHVHCEHVCVCMLPVNTDFEKCLHRLRDYIKFVLIFVQIITKRLTILICCS